MTVLVCMLYWELYIEPKTLESLSAYTSLGEVNLGCELILDCLLLNEGDCNYV